MRFGPDEAASKTRVNGETGIGLGVIRQAGSSTLAISEGVRAAVTELNTSLPPGTRVIVTSDEATFINGSIHEVELTLALAIVIVVAVIYAFLMNFRATLIPTLTIPIALIGVVAGIYLVGFSVNIITLLALVLATGMVVDDAIIVLENIIRWRNMGLTVRAASVVGTREVFLRRHLDDRDARRRVHPHLVPAGRRRWSLPRVRLRAGDLGDAFRLHRPDALPDAGRPCPG